MKRREFLLGLGASAAALSASSAIASPFGEHGGMSVYVDPPSYRGSPNYKLPKQYRRQLVKYETKERPGTIVIDPSSKYLYLVMKDGEAMRYGVGVGREGFAWSGRANIRRKAEWPDWTPPAEMIKRRPDLAKYRNGMPGGPENPLGARAMYLYKGGRDTLYRIHGTNEPWTIGQAMSSGCIRLVNDDIEDLYERVPMGTRVVVLGTPV
ncbi:L,D-transpeptidase [Tepidamorphus sp. 3E244]|uniref:L,D-transpeptidase n=1 Tax=Tepidamorphus sp. 3E244 TaxID=3385498 RepID=UPI0038FC54B4